MWVVDAMNARSEAAGPGVPGGRIRTWHMEDMSLGQAIWIGAVPDSSAVFPGTSRSMSTITGGQLAGMSRASALEFSFFLSMPTMVAATGYDLLKSLLGKGDEPDRRLRHRRPWMGCTGDRFRRFVHRRLRRGGLVHGLGAAAWVCAVCHLPHRCRRARPDLYVPACGVTTPRISSPLARRAICATRPPKMLVHWPTLFGIVIRYSRSSSLWSARQRPRDPSCDACGCSAS